jgi:hypothetical protein
MNRKRIRTGGSLSWEEREAMIKEYLTGQYSKIELWKKYTGQETEHGKLLNWMRKLGYISEDKKSRPVKLFNPTLFPLSNSNTEDTNALQRRIKELEKQLENAQLKAEGYELMIEIAEKELKIPIRKKSGTK